MATLETLFNRSRPIKYFIGENPEFAFFELKIKGPLDPDTFMIMNLKHIDQILIDLQNQLEQHHYPTLNIMFNEITTQLKTNLQIYYINYFKYKIYHPHLGISYIWQENRLSVSLNKYLFFKDQFGKTCVYFLFDDYFKIPDRERRQDLWILSQSETPCLAVLKKFPQAYACEFNNFLTHEIEYFEKI